MILNPFKDKNILITGGSRGIGLCMAKEFAGLGANIAIIARDKEALDVAQRDIEQSGSGIRCLAYACDVTDAGTLSDYINMVRYEFGSIDGIIANSGYCHPGNFHELDIEDMDRQIDVNLKGVAYTLRLGVPHLLDGGGGFIAITSSPAGNAGIFGFSLYGATKSALNILSHILRAEYASKGIRVHLLLPPDTDTPGYAAEVSLYPRATKAILDGGVFLQPEPVAKKFVRGMANNKKVISAGFSTRLLLFIMRFMPSVWDIYVRRKVRAAEAEESSLEVAYVGDESIDAEDFQDDSDNPADAAVSRSEVAPVDDVVDEPADAESSEEEIPDGDSVGGETSVDCEGDSFDDSEGDRGLGEMEDAVAEEPVAPEGDEAELDHFESEDLSDIVVSMEIELLKPFLDRITKYSMGLELKITSILVGVAEMSSAKERRWDIEAYHEQRVVPFTITIVMNADDSINIRFHTTTKLSLIIDQEFGRMFS